MEKLKNIRFNLRFFNDTDIPESVRSVKELEEKLRNNQIAFDDLMAYFFSGQLQRWLECHGEKDAELLKKLKDIDMSSMENVKDLQKRLQKLIRDLFAALGFFFDEQEITRMTASYILPYERQVEYSKNRKEAETRQASMRNEIDSYEATCLQILEGRNDLLLVKKLVGKIVDKYLPLLELDAYRFFNIMRNPITGCPQAILDMIACDKCRKVFLTDITKINNATYTQLPVPVKGWLKFTRTTQKFMIEIGPGKQPEVWPEYIKIVDDISNVDANWHMLVPKGRKIMVLCNDNVAVKDGKGVEYEASDMTNQFMILDGCSYKTTPTILKYKAILAYMEI